MLKKIIFSLTMILAATLSLPVGTHAAAKQEQGPGVGLSSAKAKDAETATDSSDKKSETATNIRDDSKVDRIIVIVGHSGNKRKITLNDYTKNSDGSWTKNWAVNGIAGANGISADKKEGDKKTPEGFFKATMNFGLKDDPGSKIKYHKISSGDFWVDDPESSYYNQLVNTNTTPKSWKSAENMINEAPYYNYGIALDYNAEGVPYKGSAIFIHCTKTAKDSYSAGCVRIPEEYMIKLIRNTDENTRFFIMSSPEAWTNFLASQ